MGVDRSHIDEDEEELKLFLRNFKDKHKRNGIDNVAAFSKSLKDLVNSGGADDNFQILFVLYATASFLAPNGESINRSLVD